MPDILYGKGSYRRDNGAFAELKLVNMFAEVSPTVEQGVAILSREGLASVATRGSGPVNAIFQRPDLFDGDVFALSGNDLYRGATLLGPITGTGPPRIAASTDELVITRGATAYSYNGTNLQAIAFPDSANVTAVTFIGGLFVYARALTHQFYWSEVLDARTVGALSFASAESAPDHLRDVVAVGDNLFLLGKETNEVHFLTGEANLPFTRISQRTERKGVIATGCAIEVDNALHFIGGDGMVYRMGDGPSLRISDHSLEERIEASATHSCFAYIYQGHTFFNVRLDDGTWAHDPSIPGQWPKMETWGQDNWIANCAVTLETGPQFGSSLDGKIFEFSGWQDDGDAMVRMFTAGFPIKGGVVPVDMLEIECNAGAGAIANPQLEMQASRDGGDTFTNWRTAKLGAQGKYRTRPRYRRCGYFDAPGALFNFRCSDAVPLRVSAVLVNESAAGRGRG